ncbi:MAG: dihydrofolate reductase family protein [Bacteroidales bacterium]
MKTGENIEFITENIIDRIIKLRKEKGKNIWIIGGGVLISLLLNTGLVDELQICYIPVILGSGVPLFPNNPKESAWTLIGSIAYDSGIIKLDYAIQR